MEAGQEQGSFTRRRTSFGSLAGTYDAVRPDWPAPTVDWLLGSPPAATVCRVLDLGAGTGKGTRAVAALGHEVVAVEPSAGMREALEAACALLPADTAARISVLSGSGESIPVEGASMDVVTAFQSWHWVEPVAAARECARVLRPGGWLSMAWHHRTEDDAWSRELSDIVKRGENQLDDEEEPPVGAAFEPAQTARFHHEMRQSVDDLVRHASTWSYVAVDPERDRILAEVEALGRRVAGPDGMVVIPMSTRCFRLRRR